MKVLPALAALLLVAVPAQSQSVEILSTDPVEDQVSVPSSYRVEFHLSEPTPPFGTDFLSKFFWSPKSQATVGALGHALDSTNALTIVFFEMTHETDVDMSFFAFGVESEGGNRMSTPYALNYTTAASTGSRTISGSAAFGARKSAEPILQRAMLEPILRNNLSRMSGGDSGLRFLSGESAQDLSFTVVLLLEEFFVESDFWTVRSASVADAAGAFSFDQVRDGGFYPIAINFSDDTGSVIGSYGYYDPDGNFEPDPIPATGDLNSLSLTMYPFESTFASEYITLAETRALEESSDNTLHEIFPQLGPGLGKVFEDGSALNWRYRYYSQTLDKITSVVVDPVTVGSVELPPASASASQLSIPPTIVDSDAAMATALSNGGSAFIAQYPDSTEVTIQMEGGDLDLSFRPAIGELFWKISFLSPPGFTFDREDIFVDLETGEVLSAGNVAIEEQPELAYRVGEVFPNPARDIIRLEIDGRLPQTGTIEIVDVLGRTVMAASGKEIKPGQQTLELDTSTLPSGSYYVVLRMPTGAPSSIPFQVAR